MTNGGDYLDIRIPSVTLDLEFNIVSYDEVIKEHHPSFFAQGFFKGLLAGFSASDFDNPLQINTSPFGIDNTNLVFVRNSEEIVCFPVATKNNRFHERWNNAESIIKEPVPSIMSSLNIITDSLEKRSIDFDKIYTGIDYINSNALKIYKNITNSNLVSKILSGTYPPVQITCFENVIKDVAETVSRFARFVNVSLELDNNVFIDCNTELMINAVTNLLANSIMFREDDDVIVEIKLKKNDNNAVFTYSDNSKGIKDEFLPFIFNPYFSKDPYNDGEIEPSMGLGLFIVKSAFNQAGANIMVTSSFEEGGVKYTASVPLSSQMPDRFESNALKLTRSRLSTVAVQLSDAVDIPYEK